VSEIEKAPAELQELVAQADTGARKPTGATAALLFAVSLAWALFQLWYASPLPFALRIGILNDTEARSLHLAFALFLAFLAWPAFKRSPRDRVPQLDWVLAFAGAFAAAYLLLFYRELAERPGTPSATDIVVASAGLVLLLVGIGLLVLVFIAMPLKYFFGEPRPVALVGMMHGFLYMAYIVCTLILAERCRWRPLDAVVILLAGTIPIASFVAERQVTRRVREGRAVLGSG